MCLGGHRSRALDHIHHLVRKAQGCQVGVLVSRSSPRFAHDGGSWQNSQWFDSAACASEGMGLRPPVAPWLAVAFIWLAVPNSPLTGSCPILPWPDAGRTESVERLVETRIAPRPANDSLSRLLLPLGRPRVAIRSGSSGGSICLRTALELEDPTVIGSGAIAMPNPSVSIPLEGLGCFLRLNRLAHCGFLGYAPVLG